MTRAAGLFLAALLLCLGPARASLAPAELDAVGMSPAPGATVPADLDFTDQRGANQRFGDILGRRPTVLVLADYDCREICGPILAVVGGALAGTGLVAGQDYDLVVIGLNPRATPADAARMGAAQLGSLAEAAHLLGGPPQAVAKVEHALGYRAAYDAESGRYAHPADILVLTAEAHVSRMLPGLALDSGTLRLALVEAGQGRIGTLGDRLHLLCYGLDPAHGVANRAVGVALTVGGVLTLAGLSLFVVMLVRRSRLRPHQPRMAPSFRGGEAEPGTGEPRPSSPKRPGSGSPLRSVRNDDTAHTAVLHPGSRT